MYSWRQYARPRAWAAQAGLQAAGTAGQHKTWEFAVRERELAGNRHRSKATHISVKGTHNLIILAKRFQPATGLCLAELVNYHANQLIR